MTEKLTNEQMRVLSEADKNARGYIDQRVRSINAVIIGVVIVVAVAVVTMILELFRFNSVVYREYTQKTGINNTLLEENRNNQKIIVQNQETIQKLLVK